MYRIDSSSLGYSICLFSVGWYTTIFLWPKLPCLNYTDITGNGSCFYYIRQPIVVASLESAWGS